MERRNRSLKALKELRYIDSLDDQERADGLLRWSSKYIQKEQSKFDFDLELDDLKTLSELYYKNLEFLKAFTQEMKDEMRKTKKMQAFLKNG